MPRFYFKVTTGVGIASEDDAVDLPSPEAARAEAMMTAAEMAKEGGAAPKDISIAIRDEKGEAVGTVRLTLAYDGGAS
jgi:hypothetical protein